MSELLAKGEYALPSSSQMIDINNQLTQFKEDILGMLSQYEDRMNSKLANYLEENTSQKKNYETSITAFNTKYGEISQSVASVNVKFDRLTHYEAFSRKANDQITTHEIRLNNISKELTKACYKYDKIYMDNLLLPGFIGDCCKFKTARDFFDDTITQLSTFNTFKEKQIMDLKSYKERLETVIKSFNMQVDSFSKNNMKYTNDCITDSENKAKEIIKDLNGQINELSLENSRYAVEIKKQSKDLSLEWEKMLQIKEEIYSKFESNVNEYKKSNQHTLNAFELFKTEFMNIKKKFGELTEFIKDVRFRKNLKADVKKREITSLVKKINFKRKNSYDGNDNNATDNPKNKIKEKNTINNTQNELRQSQSHDIESRIKKYINGETDAEHVSQYHNYYHNYNNNKEDNNIRNVVVNQLENEKEIIDISIESNDKIIHELGAELEQSNCKNLRESIDRDNKRNNGRKSQSESPIPTQSYSCSQVNTAFPMVNLNNNHNNNISFNSEKDNNKRHYSVSSLQPFLNPFDVKKEQRELDKKINYTEKKVFNLEAYTKQKITELSNQISILLSCSGINVNVNGIIQSVSVGQGNRSNSNPKSIKQRRNDMNQTDCAMNISNKVVPVSVVDLVNKNQFPNLNSYLSSLTNYGTIGLTNKPKQIKPRVKTGREHPEKILIQTLGCYQDEAFSNNMKEVQVNTVSLRDANRKTTHGSINSNIPEYRVLKKIEKKQIIDCDCKITPTRWIQLQQVMKHVPTSDVNLVNEIK